MEKTIEELLQAPCWIIDILPEQVPADGPGQYFAVEKYFLEKVLFVNMILRMNILNFTKSH